MNSIRFHKIIGLFSSQTKYEKRGNIIFYYILSKGQNKENLPAALRKLTRSCSDIRQYLCVENEIDAE